MANSVPAAGANYQASYPLDPRTQAPRKPIPYVKDFFTHLQEAYPWVAIPRFTDTSWWYKNIGRYLRAPSWGPAYHNNEMNRQTSGAQVNEDFSATALLKLETDLGVTASLARSTPTANEAHAFQPQEVRTTTLIAGVKVLDKRIQVTADTKAGDLLGWAKERPLIGGGNKVGLLGPLKQLLEFYPPGTTLMQIVEDLNRIEIISIDVNNPEGHGYEPRIYQFNGQPVRGRAMIDVAEELKDQHLVNANFVEDVKQVHEKASQSGGHLVFAQGEEGSKTPMRLVGAGLAGEVSSAMVGQFFEGCGEVYLPDVSTEGSHIAAALAVKRLAHETVGEGVATGQTIYVHGGKLIVGKTNGLDAGQLYADLSQFASTDQPVTVATMMFMPGDLGILGETVQHAVAYKMAEERLATDVVRAQSPTHGGKKVNGSDHYRDDAAGFQGPFYNLNQNEKEWSTVVIGARTPARVTLFEGPVAQTANLEIMRPVMQYSPNHGIATQAPLGFGSNAMLSFTARHWLPKAEDDSRMMARGKPLADGGIMHLPTDFQPALKSALGTFGRGLVGLATLQAVPGRAYENTRVNGELLEMIAEIDDFEGFVSLEAIPDQVLARASDPREGFRPFHFQLEDGTRNYAFLVSEPEELPDGMRERLRDILHDSLGLLFIVNPERDTYTIIHHHAAAKNNWSEYATEGAPVFHALGGNMSFQNMEADAHVTNMMLSAWGMSSDGRDLHEVTDNLSADRKADLMLAAALDAVAGKGAAMTTKYTLISEALEAVDLPGAQLGGAKAITLSPFDEASRFAAMEMLEVVASKTGLYISGPDQGTGVITRIVAEPSWLKRTLGQKTREESFFLINAAATDRSNRFHMGGAETAHEKIRGLGKETSRATAGGVYAGIRRYNHLRSEADQAILGVLGPQTYMDYSGGKPVEKSTVIPVGNTSYENWISKMGRNGLFIQGAGGVGSQLIDMALEDKLPIIAVSDMNVDVLLQTREKISQATPGQPPPIYIFDSGAAQGFYSQEEYAKQLAVARAAATQGFLIIATDTADSIRQVAEARPYQVGIFSPNASSHPITLEVINALARASVHAVLGAANNVLALDENGSYSTVETAALRAGIFIPNDSAINMMGAATILYGAVGMNDEKIRALNQVVGNRVREEFVAAFAQGIGPQSYRDQRAQARWDREVDAGRSVGGRSHNPQQPPPRSEE